MLSNKELEDMRYQLRYDAPEDLLDWLGGKVVELIDEVLWWRKYSEDNLKLLVFRSVADGK